MSTPTNQNAKATPLTHRDSLATEDKQREVVRTVTVPTNKCRCDGHVIAPIWPSPTLGRNCASKLSTVVLRPNGRTPWISRPTQNQPPQDHRRRYVADRHAFKDQGRSGTAGLQGHTGNTQLNYLITYIYCFAHQW